MEDESLKWFTKSVTNRELEQLSKQRYSEANKSGWRMPRLLEARKDVESCEKPRGTANRYRSGDVRMGEPSNLKSCYLYRSQRRELKHLSTCRKRKKRSISRVVASETERAQTDIVTAMSGL